MRSQLAAPLGVQVPRLRHAPRVRGSAWEDVSDVAKAYGLVLDPWQENVLQAAMGERSDGQWATPRVGVSVPRQNGKGALIEARELAGLLVFGEQVIVHSAHEQKTARVGFDRIRSYFENYDDLRKRVKQVGTALNREYIELLSGQRLVFPARSKGAIRGFSIDCLILDEGQILGDTAWEAIQPTISARPNPQTWLLGTPPTPLDDGAVFERMREAAMVGKDGRLCWCEWSAANGSALDDREAWAQANPALGHRITVEAIQDERQSMSEEGFARERLGVWMDMTSQAVIDPAAWAELADADAARPSPVAFAVDIPPDRSTASIAIVGDRVDGMMQAEIVHSTNERGTAWVPARMADLVAKWSPVGVFLDASAPAGSLLGPLADLGVEVVTVSARERGQACGMFFDAVTEKQLRHGNDPRLNTALGAARKRPLGDAWEWHRKNATADISPLVAVTLALHGVRSGRTPQRSNKAMFK